MPVALLFEGGDGLNPNESCIQTNSQDMLASSYLCVSLITNSSSYCLAVQNYMAPVASTSSLSHSRLLPRNTVSNAPRRSPAVLNKSVQLALSHPFLYLCFIVLGGLLSLALVVYFVYCIARYCQRRKRKAHPLLLSPFPTAGSSSSVKSLGSRLNATEKLSLGLVETPPTPTLLFGTVSFDRNIAITELSDTITEMDITEAVYECGTVSCKDGPTKPAEMNVGSRDIPPYSRSSSTTVVARDAALSYFPEPTKDADPAISSPNKPIQVPVTLPLEDSTDVEACISQLAHLRRAQERRNSTSSSTGNAYKPRLSSPLVSGRVISAQDYFSCIDN